jgi:DNA mismatch repair protein MutS
VVDKCFSRVGAADDLARGRSTFMVEMIETAQILHQATKYSLVILDEIGRGTATYDGLSIATGTLEYLYQHNASRGLFATHYHELTALEAALPGMVTACAAVREYDGKIHFMHQIVRGHADQSYGLHVAQLAGLPAEVIARAQDILSQLNAQRKPLLDQADAPPAVIKHAPAASPLLDLIKTIDPDQLTPKDALEMMYRLKKMLKE